MCIASPSDFRRITSRENLIHPPSRELLGFLGSLSTVELAYGKTWKNYGYKMRSQRRVGVCSSSSRRVLLPYGKADTSQNRLHHFNMISKSAVSVYETIFAIQLRYRLYVHVKPMKSSCADYEKRNRHHVAKMMHPQKTNFSALCQSLLLSATSPARGGSSPSPGSTPSRTPARTHAPRDRLRRPC